MYPLSKERSQVNFDHIHGVFLAIDATFSVFNVKKMFEPKKARKG